MTKNESVEQMDRISIFMHKKEKFNFYMDQDKMPDNYMIKPTSLESEHETTFTLR